MTDAAILTTNVIYTGSIKSLRTSDLTQNWLYPAADYSVFCSAGNQVYAGKKGNIIALKDLGSSAQLIWEKTITGTPKIMLVADNKLFVTTSEGFIYCFGTTSSSATLPQSDITLVALGSEWKYLDNGSDQGIAWRALEFDDNTWASGLAELGYGDGDETTVVAGRSLYITTYFRKVFNVTNAADFVNLSINVKIDDGAIVYLNEVEVSRTRLSGDINYLTEASSGESWEVSPIDTSILLEGENVFAVEIHQTSLSSSDISFDMKMTGVNNGTITRWPPNDAWTTNAQDVIATTGVNDGYCIVLGADSGRLMEELCKQTKMNIIGLDTNHTTVAQLRTRWANMELSGERISVQEGEITSAMFPPYLASLIVIENAITAGIDQGNIFVEKMFHSLRPYGGQICVAGNYVSLFTDAIAAANLENASVTLSGGYTILKRVGALKHSADWTHQNADAANTRVSKDELVKPPLGLLWFGGSSNVKTLPRHGHGPSEEIINGRLIIEGVNYLRAFDVYTGRTLWESYLPGIGARYDNTSHYPGANHLGSNYASATNGIYVCQTTTCRRLNPADGETISIFTLPNGSWFSQAKIWDDLLIVAADPFAFADSLGSVGQNNWDETCSRELTVMNRYSGDVLWSRVAANAFHHNSIIVGDNILYCIDRLPPGQVDALSRRGLSPSDTGAIFKLLALNIRTGKEIWSSTNNIFGTWLTYSDEHNLLLQAGRPSRDMVTGEPEGRLITYNAQTGAVLWDKLIGSNDEGPYLIIGDKLIMQTTYYGTALNILSGTTYMRRHPLTGTSVQWRFDRKYGCNTAIGSKNMLTFRSGAAGFYDLKRNGGTGNFGGFKSGCTANLIPANGVLNAPDYTRTCICTYQNQTSLALVHMPELETWSTQPAPTANAPIKQVGINFAARGDRVTDEGTLWMDYPSVGGTSPNIPIATEGSPLYFRKHSMLVNGTGMKWVTSSGATGLTQITMTMGNTQPEPYHVRLYFSEPENINLGQRIFNVSIQGSTVLTNFDISAEPLPNVVVKEFSGIMIENNMTIDLLSITGDTVLCGIEATIANPPIIENSFASFITTNSAQLNGDMLFVGEPPFRVQLFWGSENNETNATSWANTNEILDPNTGALSIPITNLNPDQTYYYRFYASNADGETWASATTSFATQSALKLHNITCTSGSGGYTSPSGTMQIPEGTDTNIIISADSHYHISGIWTNGTLLDSYTYDKTFTNTLLTLNNISVDIVMTVSFAEILSIHDVPELWLSTYYPNTNDYDAASLSDTDNDGMAAWQEYIAGTIPTDSESLLKIQTLHSLNTNKIVISWFGVSNKSYTLKQTTNLFSPWTEAISNIPGNMSLNVYTADVQQADNIFYKIIVNP